MRNNRLRPIWLGAVFIGGMTTLRALVVIPSAMAHGQTIEAAEALRLAVIGVFGGAAAGAVYAFIGRPLRRVPHYGAFLAGIVTAASYFAIVLYLVSHVSREVGFSFMKPSSRFAYVACTLIFGSLLGNEFQKSPVDVPTE